MNILHFIFVIVCVHYTSSQFYPPNKTKSKSPCDSGAQVALVEQFFNIIFTEFQVTPPVCVCVQMCAEQSTYCYPNGCLKRDANVKRVDSTQSTQPKSPKSFMFIVDERSDMAKNPPEPHAEDPRTTTPKEALHDFMVEMRPDVFKNKYSMLVKHKKTPNIKLKYNLREQVKYMKTDQIKTESFEFSKTRWPQNKPYGRRHNTRSAPSIGKTNVFMSMLPADHYAEYTPKYSKRDIASTLNSDDPIAKAFYLYEKSVNHTDNDVEPPISLETLIDNLIQNSINAKHSENNNTGPNIDNENQTENKTTVIIETTTSNGTVDVISLNATVETTDKNSYTDNIPTNTNKFNEMIKNLSKRIDIQNNTSLKLASSITTDFDEERSWDVNIKPNLTACETNTTKMDETEIAPYNEIESTTATFKDNMVTKKNRQKRVRNSKLVKIYH